MNAFHEYVDDYKKQLEKGVIQKAYKGLLEYVMVLKTHFQNSHPDYFVSGSLYYGYMDMTYFSCMPKSLKERQLKIAVVLIHHPLHFEVWLGGYNKQAQAEYWKLFKESGWNQYHLVPTIQGYDAILEHVLVEDPDFSDLDALTKQIESGTLKFIEDVEDFLRKNV
jgi:hypothetical protein